MPTFRITADWHNSRPLASQIISIPEEQLPDRQIRRDIVIRKKARDYFPTADDLSWANLDADKPQPF